VRVINCIYCSQETDNPDEICNKCKEEEEVGVGAWILAGFWEPIG